MTNVARTYRFPIVVSGLMLIALCSWAWQDWQNFADHVEEMERHRAVGVSKMLAGAIHSLEENGRLKREEMERILEHVIHDSPYDFLVLEQEGKRIFQVGNIPAALILPSEETESFSKGFYLFSRKVQLHEGDGGSDALAASAMVNNASGLGTISGQQLMVIGGDVRDHGYPKAITHMFVPLAAAILLLATSVMAWVMVIRSRLLAEKLRTERARSAHLEDLGLAAAGLAHETKNPLGIVSGIAQQIARNPEVPEQSRVMIETIIDEIDKSASRLGHFLTFARQREVNAVPLDIRELVTKIAEILQPEFDLAGVDLEVNCPPLIIVGDEDMLRQVLVNLLLNSLQASAQGAGVTVRVERSGARASLVVEDQGCGIAPDLLPSIFKPYVAGNPDGHGLGLAIVKRFVEDHGWTIKADSQLNQGTVITVSGLVLSQGEKE